MTLAIIMTFVAVLLIALGIIGIVYPILPGSLSALAGILLWSFTVQAAEGWWTLGLAGSCVLAGMGAQAVLTGRTMKKRQIPNRSILWGIVGAVIGMFLIPVLGLFIGFALALLVSEATRHGDLPQATSNTLAALKSMGIGIVVELACALTAATIFSIAAIIYFATA